MYQISRTHLIGYLVEDGITSSVHAKHTFSRTSIMLRFLFLAPYARTTRYEEAFLPFCLKAKNGLIINTAL